MKPERRRSLSSAVLGLASVVLGLLGAAGVYDDLRHGIEVFVVAAALWAGLLLALGAWLLWAGFVGTRLSSEIGTQRLPVRRRPLALARLAVVGLIALPFFLILWPHSHLTREDVYPAAMRSDLRQLRYTQELYYGEHGRYATREDLAADEDSLSLLTSEGVALRITLAEGAKGGPPAPCTRGSVGSAA